MAQGHLADRKNQTVKSMKFHKNRFTPPPKKKKIHCHLNINLENLLLKSFSKNYCICEHFVAFNRTARHLFSH